MSRKEEVKKELHLYLRRLQKLKEKKAKYGLEAPISVELEIEDIEEKVDQLQTDLKNIEEKDALIHDPRRSQKIRILSAINDFAEAGGINRIPVHDLTQQFKEYGSIEQELKELEDEEYVQMTSRRFGGKLYSYLEITQKGANLLRNK